MANYSRNQLSFTYPIVIRSHADLIVNGKLQCNYLPKITSDNPELVTLKGCKYFVCGEGLKYSLDERTVFGATKMLRDLNGIESHTELRLADFTTNVNPKNFDRSNHNISGIISNIRTITGQELFTLLFRDDHDKINNNHADNYGIRPDAATKVRIVYDMLPLSMLTQLLLDWIHSTYPASCGIIPSIANIMTGAQFNKLFPGPKMRMFTYSMVHNDYNWQAGTNTCYNFNTTTHCQDGLYFIDPCNKKDWLNYGYKTMYWQATVTIPDHATVVIEPYTIKFKSNIVEIQNITRI